MKGIIMSAGKGTRLHPLTKVVSKEMLPIYDKPMIYYPIETLVKAGLTDILLIFSEDHLERYKQLLGDGSQFGARFSYDVQKVRRGTADVLIIGEEFIGDDDVTIIFGDNIFEHDFAESIKNFTGGGVINVKQVKNPDRYGVVEFDQNMKVISIEEKPQYPKSDYAIVGMFTYDNRAVQFAKEVTLSVRGELEITDVHKRYLKLGDLKVNVVEGIWEDAGTFDSLLRVNNYMAEKKQNANFKNTEPKPR